MTVYPVSNIRPITKQAHVTKFAAHLKKIKLNEKKCIVDET